MVIKPEKQKIGARGQYVNCTFPEHLAAPGFNSSLVNTYLDEGSTAAKAMIDGAFPRTETKPMRIGKLFHCSLLEPQRWAATYIAKTWNETTTAGKKEKAKHAAKGLIPVALDEWNLVIAMKGAVYQAAQARTKDGDSMLAELLLTTGRVEQSILWWDTEEDVPLKGRLDKIVSVPGAPGIVVDIKTADQWKPDAWARASALKYGYHRQAWMYTDAYEAVHGTRPRHIHVVVHKSPPYEVALYELGEQELELGMEDVRRALSELKERMAANRWHSDAERGVRPVSFPAWVYAKRERENEPTPAFTFGGEAVSL